MVSSYTIRSGQSGRASSLNDDFPSWQPTIDALSVPLLGKELITSQQANLNDLIREFKDVFSTKPGKTNLIEHHIHTGDTKPFKTECHKLSRQWLNRSLRTCWAKEL